MFKARWPSFVYQSTGKYQKQLFQYWSVTRPQPVYISTGAFCRDFSREFYGRFWVQWINRKAPGSSRTDNKMEAAWFFPEFQSGFDLFFESPFWSERLFWWAFLAFWAENRAELCFNFFRELFYERGARDWPELLFQISLPGPKPIHFQR